MKLVSARIAKTLSINEKQVVDTIGLLDGGSTGLFFARYRKEVTGGLDDIQLRNLDERLHYLRELDARRVVIISSIEEQDKMTDGLVHISQLTDVLVQDPRKVVKSGDVVRVKVQEIDLPRKRISLTMKMFEVQARPVGKEKYE